jgi:hypothetical protein
MKSFNDNVSELSKLAKNLNIIKIMPKSRERSKDSVDSYPLPKTRGNWASAFILNG